MQYQLMVCTSVNTTRNDIIIFVIKDQVRLGDKAAIGDHVIEYHLPHGITLRRLIWDHTGPAKGV